MDGYASRKFLITLAIIAGTIGLAAFERMDANVALVFGACVAGYNWANVRSAQAADQK